MIRLPGFVAREHTVTVPLDHADPDGATIEVFAREILDPTKLDDDLPCLLFLQGGPGGKSPRPIDRSSWVDVALRTHRVVLLDQRGTGRSTPITAAITRDRTAQEVGRLSRAGSAPTRSSRMQRSCDESSSVNAPGTPWVRVTAVS